jgi:hypothetical protein
MPRFTLLAVFGSFIHAISREMLSLIIFNQRSSGVISGKVLLGGFREFKGLPT